MWHPFGPQPSRFLRKSLLHWPALYCRAPLVIPSVGCLMVPVHTLKHRNQGKTRGLDRNTVRWCTRAASWYRKSLRRNIHIYDARMIGCGWHNTGTTMLCKWVPSFACFLQAWFHNIPMHVLFQTKLAYVKNLTRGKWRDFWQIQFRDTRSLSTKLFRTFASRLSKAHWCAHVSHQCVDRVKVNDD